TMQAQMFRQFKKILLMQVMILQSSRQAMMLITALTNVANTIGKQQKNRQVAAAVMIAKWKTGNAQIWPHARIRDVVRTMLIASIRIVAKKLKRMLKKLQVVNHNA